MSFLDGFSIEPLSDVRDQAAAEAFFEQSHQTTGVVPDQLTTDKDPALYPAVKKVFGNDTKHRDVKYKNNCLEQDHRGIKSRYQAMKGFNDIFCALKFCTVFEEIRQLSRMNNKTRSERRRETLSKIQQYGEVRGVVS